MISNKNMIAGLLFLAFGLLSLIVLIPFGIQQPQSVQYKALSPSYWPNIVSVVISAIGLALMIGTFLSARSGRANDAAREAEAAPISGWHSVRPFIALAICFALYFALEPLGFVLTTAMAVAALMILAGEFRPHIILPVSILVPFGLHVFFTKAASVPIPAGILEPLLLRI